MTAFDESIKRLGRAERTAMCNIRRAETMPSPYADRHEWFDFVATPSHATLELDRLAATHSSRFTFKLYVADKVVAIKQGTAALEVQS